MKTNPIYHFKSLTETGIDKVPEGAAVYIENAGSGSPRQVLKVSLGSLNSSSTVQDFLNEPNLYTEISVESLNIVKRVDPNNPGVSPSTIYTTWANDFNVCMTDANNGNAVNTNEVIYAIELPSSPTNGDIIYFMDGSGNAQNRPILIKRNGNTIDNRAEDLTCDVNYFDIKLVYNAGNWSLGGK